MSVYPLNTHTRNASTLYPQSSSYSEECARRSCRWYLTDQIRKEGYKTFRDYRLHSGEARTFADYMAYDILCPRCGGRMHPIARELDYHDLALYTCHECNKKN